MKKIFTLIIVGTGFFLSASSQRLLTEDFNYAAGQLTDANGGANVSGGAWVTNSGSAKYIPVVTGDLSYPDYLTSPAAGSGRILLDTTKATAEDAFINFTAQASNTVYASFLLNLTTTDNLTVHDSATGDYFISLLSSTSTTNYNARIYIRQGATANTFNVGIAAQTAASTPIVWIATDLPIAATHLVTVAYQIVAGPTNDVAKLWVDEPVSTAEPVAQATSLYSTGTEPADIGRFAVRQSYTSGKGSTPKCEIDAIKVSTSWADATLPVLLKSFTASVQNGAINLNWTTVNEINMKEYVIERSIDAKNFAGIGMVSAKNSVIENNYSYSDLKALNGTSYYRLKMTDNDGVYRYSNVIPGSVKILQKLSVLGGVVNNTLVISHGLASNGATIKIVSMNGTVTAVQHVQAGVSQTIMDVSKLAAGNYVAMFMNGNDKQTVQFVKQ